MTVEKYIIRESFYFDDKNKTGEVPTDRFVSIMKDNLKVMLLDKEWDVLLKRLTVPKKSDLLSEPVLVNFSNFEMDIIQVNPEYAIMVNYADVENRKPKSILAEILREIFKKFKTPEEFVASLPEGQRKYVTEQDIRKCFTAVDSKIDNNEFSDIMKSLDKKRLLGKKADNKIYFGDLSEAIVEEARPLVEEVSINNKDCRKNFEWV